MRHSLPVVAMRFIPHICRRAGFPHRVVPRKSPLWDIDTVLLHKWVISYLAKINPFA